MNMILATPAEPVETLRWRAPLLEMIDQRVLPHRFEYIQCDSADAVADGIRTMVVLGAPAIGCAAAYGVALEALRLSRENGHIFSQGLEGAFNLLAASRPTAVNLFWALRRMRNAWDSVKDRPSALVANALLAKAHEMLGEDLRINRMMGAHGAALL